MNPHTIKTMSNHAAGDDDRYEAPRRPAVPAGAGIPDDEIPF